jgi:hypothetical protein
MSLYFPDDRQPFLLRCHIICQPLEVFLLPAACSFTLLHVASNSFDLSVSVFAVQTHEEMEIEAWAYKPEPQSQQVQRVCLKDVESGHSGMCNKPNLYCIGIAYCAAFGKKIWPASMAFIGRRLTFIPIYIAHRVSNYHGHSGLQLCNFNQFYACALVAGFVALRETSKAA